MTTPGKPDRPPAGQPLVQEIRTLLGRLQQRRHTDEELVWLQQNCSSARLAALLSDMTPLTLEFVDAVGCLQPVNGITAAHRLGVPKGSVSKISRKLLALKLLRLEFLPHNKKEVLFRLTLLGEELFALHQVMRRRTEAGVSRFFARYSDDELQVIARFLRDGATASWLEPDGSDTGDN